MAEDHDPESGPGTAAFVPDFSDDEHTGTQSWVPDFSDDTGAQPVPVVTEPEAPEPPSEPPDAPAEREPTGAAVPPVTVPGRYLYLKWWKLALVIAAVWCAAAPVGLGLFSWWYNTIDKSLPVFVVLVYVVACAVGGVMLAMTEGRPLISALSVAVMSGPLASVAAAAPLYGFYYCQQTGHCLVGIIPY
ncbi:hypothetical protein [Mycobacterium servetii]|uniref:Transmembrane protein n=1 Tax=Mycobacterium servetii TaxID=3237418 RepID=A0ABV4C6P6_9MYCO